MRKKTPNPKRRRGSKLKRKASRRTVPAPRTLFLSHSHADGTRAALFASWLENAFDPGVSVICTSLPRDRIEAGMVTSGLLDRLKRCDVALALLTPNSKASPWVYYEMGAAQALGLRFIPCLVGSLGYLDLPPQAYEYQGALLQEPDELLKLMNALSQLLGLAFHSDLDVRALAREFAKGDA